MNYFGNTSNARLGLPARPKHVTPRALFFILAVPITIAIIWFGSRTGTMKRATDLEHSVTHPSTLLSAEKKPKPPAGKLMMQPTERAALPPLPDWPKIEAANAARAAQMPGAPIPAPTVVGPSAAPVAGAAPVAPVSPARPAYTPLSYNAHHDRVFGGSCSGQLVLSSTGLQFNCPDDAHSNLQIAINEISAVDENGVRLTSGKKLHFTITGMSKPSEQELFADWYNRIR